MRVGVLVAGLFSSAKGFAHKRDTEGVADSLIHGTQEILVDEIQRFPLPLSYFILASVSFPCWPLSWKPSIHNLANIDDCAVAAKHQITHKVEDQSPNNQKLDEIS